MRILEVVHIIWVDSESSNSWTEVMDLKRDLSNIHSVGFLLHQDSEKYVLSVSFDPENDSANAIMWIPKDSVKKVVPIAAISL